MVPCISYILMPSAATNFVPRMPTTREAVLLRYRHARCKTTRECCSGHDIRVLVIDGLAAHNAADDTSFG